MNKDNQWPTMNVEKGGFIVEKCEKVMECVINDREVLQRKAHLLLGLIGGIATLASGSWIDPSKKLPPLVEHALAAEIVLLVILGVLLICTCLAPSDYAAPGGEPSRMLQPDFANQEMPWLILGYCFLVQRAIDANLNANRRIAKWLRVVGVGVFVSPLVAHVIGEFSQPSRHSPAQTIAPAQTRLLERCSIAGSCRLERQSVPESESPPAIEVWMVLAPAVEAAAEVSVLRS